MDLYDGREIRPLVLGLDVKILSHAPPAIGIFILQLAFVSYQYEMNASLTFGVATLTFLNAIILLDLLFFEPTLVYVHDVLYGGCGIRWLQGVFLVWPFINSLGLFYLAQSNRDFYPFLEHLPAFSLPLLGVAVSFLGLYIRRRAVIENFQFHSGTVETSSTDSFTSKGILTSGWWGCVRHPDYLGDIILSIGLAIPAGYAGVVPWIAPVCVFLTTCCRIRENEKSSQKGHDKTVWKNYVATVPYRLIPRIY